MVLKEKNKTPVGGFAFYYETADGSEIRVPEGQASANGLNQLVSLVKASFANNGIPIPDDLLHQAEHQICLRQPDINSACYSGGLGDDIHHKVMRPLLTKIENVAKKAGFKHVAAAANKVKKCGACGGRKTYKPGSRNMGRAGVVNKLNSGKFASNAEHKYN